MYTKPSFECSIKDLAGLLLHHNLMTLLIFKELVNQ